MLKQNQKQFDEISEGVKLKMRKKHKIKDLSYQDNFSLLENSEIIDILPNKFMVTSPEKQKEMEDFFAKIPLGKVMRTKFPDEQIWKLYSGRLRLYASLLNIKNISIHAKKNDAGYFIYVKKKGDEKNESLEVKSV